MSDTLELDAYRFPVSVEVRASDDTLVKELKKRIGSAAVDAGEPFFWRALISNTRTDSHWTEMRPSSLKNYARDAAAGVAFQDSHSTRSIVNTFGRSMSGEYTPLDENKYAKVEADFYTFRGVDPLIDSFIKRMEIGLANDVSIGFVPGKYICSICKRDMLSWNMDDWEDNCWHWLGMEYEKEKGGEKVICTAGVEDSRLVEVSTVYAGSTPGAMILRAERMIAAGKLSDSMARKLEDRYQTRILGASKLYVPLSIESQEDRMGVRNPEPQGETPAEPKVEERSEPSTPAAVPQIDPLAVPTFEGVRDLLMSRGLVKGTLVESVRALIDENARLVPLADQGAQYRKDTIDAALAEGVRAYGNDFMTETYRGMMDSLSLDHIKRMRDDWAFVAKKTIPTERKTLGDGEGIQSAVQDDDPKRYKA